MGRTWPNVDAERVNVAGYYWNEKLKKLARLDEGEKLPRKQEWEFIAKDHELSSSQVVRRLFDRYPGMDVNEFTYTVKSPTGRRLPLGDHPWLSHPWRLAAGGVALLALGLGAGWAAAQRA